MSIFASKYRSNEVCSAQAKPLPSRLPQALVSMILVMPVVAVADGYVPKASSGMLITDKDYRIGISQKIDSHMSSYPMSTGYDGFEPDTASIELPELGSQSGRFIERNQHQALGEWSLQRINGTASLLDDPWSQEILENLAWQINAQARTQAPLALVVVNSADINAFAIPGGVMGINTGTILSAESMDEVASVVAHEVAHLSQRHYEYRDDANNKARMLQVGSFLAALAAASVDGDAASAIMLGGQTAALNSQMAFSRSNEREADRIGMQIMARAGYDPRAMPKFFATLNQKTQLNSSEQTYLPSFIMTHPLSSERMSEAQSRANSYDTAALTSKRSQVIFDLLKWRLKVLTQQSNEAELMTASSKSDGARLAYAYWLGTQGRYQGAYDLLDQLQQKLNQPSNASNADKVETHVLLAVTQAQIAGMQGKWQDAEQSLQPYYSLYPERRDIKLSITEAWLQQDKYQEVMTTLKPMSQQRPHDIATLSRLQRAYELMAKDKSSTSSNSLIVNRDDKSHKQGSQAKALADVATIHTLRYRSQAQLWQGRYNDALVSLEQAKRMAQSSDDNSNKLGQAAHTINMTPLLATLQDDIRKVKTARDFKP